MQVTSGESKRRLILLEHTLGRIATMHLGKSQEFPKCAAVSGWSLQVLGSSPASTRCS
jgi:hypothetical protein